MSPTLSPKSPAMRRRSLLVATLAGALRPAVANAATAATALPHPTSMPDEAAAAARRGQALVLLVSLPGCPYCEQVRRLYLLPLNEANGRGVVQIDVDADVPLIDFDRVTRTDAAFARARRATFTPTVLFMDPVGVEVAERLIGAGNPDYYGGYLDQRLEAARRAVQSRR